MRDGYVEGEYVQVLGSSTYWRVVGREGKGYTITRDAGTRAKQDRDLGLKPKSARDDSGMTLVRRDVLEAKLRPAQAKGATS